MDGDGLLTLEPLDPGTATEVEDPAVRDSLQRLTARLASAPESWAETDREEVRSRFDARAVDWATRDTPAYRLPLEDALARGEVPAGGLCLEVGSGTGIQTPTLLGHFDEVLALDLSFEMLSRTPPGRGDRIVADASALPLPPARLDAIVCVNAFLFAPEYLRVLAPGGRVVFASTRAERTPIYLAPQAVLAALRGEEASFTGRTARAGEGCWTVCRRGG